MYRYIHITIHIYIYIHTVSFHNFKSQIDKLSVSNPKSKYVGCLSVLSQISNCQGRQGLGRKNKHDILKTDRINVIYIYIYIYMLYKCMHMLNVK